MPIKNHQKHSIQQQKRNNASGLDDPNGKIILYQAPDGSISLQVQLVKETVWLNLNQLADLFERHKSVISRHLNNIFQSGELDKESTVAKFATVQQEGGRRVVRQVEFYNLDAIISVGYRVNSLRGTQFRIWATKVLRDHLLKGYTTNQRRLKELRKTIRLVARVANHRGLSSDEASAILQILNEYSHALDLLDDFDHGHLDPPNVVSTQIEQLTMDEARRLVAILQRRFQDNTLFGREKDAGLESALAAVFQTAGGQEVYPSLEKKAAHLLYFLVKNHPFVDGNKRIAASLFLWFLEKNNALYLDDGQQRISEEALVAITLLIAESHPTDKELIVRLVTWLLHKHVP